MMTYRGHIKNGTVVLDEPVALPEGAEVAVSLMGNVESVADEQGPTLYERLKPLIGKVEGLPADAALNHDHYLYGTPKR
jgi:hypothetical protein